MRAAAARAARLGARSRRAGGSPAARRCRCAGTRPRRRRLRLRATGRDDALARLADAPRPRTSSYSRGVVLLGAAAAARVAPRPSTSSRRNRITVMLSRPPASLAAAISAAPEPARASSARLEDRLELGLVDHRGQAVRAEQEHVAGRAPGRRRRRPATLGSGPERAGDHRALRVRLGLLLGELAARARARRPASGPWSGGSGRRRAAGRRASRRRGRRSPRPRRRRRP